MIWRCLTNAGVSKLFVRASATILRVRKGMSLTDPARTSSRTKYSMISIWREISAHRIFAHSNASNIVCIKKSGFSLGKSKISERFTQVYRFLACLASCDKFSLGSWKWHVVLTPTLPRDGAAIHHNNIYRVWSAGISVPSPICIHPTPQSVRVFVQNLIDVAFITS